MSDAYETCWAEDRNSPTQAETSNVRFWPNAPIDQPRLNGRCLDIAAVFGVHVTGSRGSTPVDRLRSGARTREQAFGEADQADLDRISRLLTSRAGRLRANCVIISIWV